LPLLDTEAFKVTKEEFRNKLSGFIVKLLQHYSTSHATNTNTNSDGVHLKYGRIETKEDFKYLARKLTHTILEKEMSRIASLSLSSSCDLDLALTDSKKAKAHEYVTNYMRNFPNGYSRKVDENK
jgi:histone-lysine N-methyltransferase SETD2